MYFIVLQSIKVRCFPLGLEPYLKDLMRVGVLIDRSRSGRSARINQETVDEINEFLQTYPGSNVRSVTEASSIPQTTTTDRIRIEHLLLNPDKARFVQQLYEEDAVTIID